MALAVFDRTTRPADTRDARPRKEGDEDGGAPFGRPGYGSHWGGAIWRRCQFHLAENAIHHAPSREIRERIGAELRQVWNAETADQAQKRLDEIVAAYRAKAPNLAEWLETNIPEGLPSFTLPAPHRKRMRTSNPIERAVQQEIKRRTVKVRIFPSRDAVQRLVGAILVEIDDKWSEPLRVFRRPDLSNYVAMVWLSSIA